MKWKHIGREEQANSTQQGPQTYTGPATVRQHTQTLGEEFPLVAAACNSACVWFTHFNCCHGSQGWRRALLLWERTSKGAFWVCRVEETQRYVCLALFFFKCACVSACVCVSVSYCAMSQGCRDVCQRSRHTVRAASLLGLPRSTPLQPHLVLANHASFAMVTGQTVARVTSRCIRVAGIELVDFTSQWWHCLYELGVSPTHARATQRQTHRSSEVVWRLFHAWLNMHCIVYSTSTGDVSARASQLMHWHMHMILTTTRHT